jgi:hypothetical protein
MMPYKVTEDCANAEVAANAAIAMRVDFLN